jgi:curved DNA-binding protein CbpA
LGPTFTRRELERARRRLAWDLHPDRHRGASLHERKAREDALKRVNAAFDLLIVDAT